MTPKHVVFVSEVPYYGYTNWFTYVTLSVTVIESC